MTHRAGAGRGTSRTDPALDADRTKETGAASVARLAHRPSVFVQMAKVGNSRAHDVGMQTGRTLPLNMSPVFF